MRTLRALLLAALMVLASTLVVHAQSAPAVPPALPQTPFAGYTTFVDPSENAFSVEVPAGWHVQGGMTRASAIDVRPWVRVSSPDSLIVAFIGDGQISPGTVPTQTLLACGYGIGRRYGSAIILPYIPARKFAEKYARMKLGKAVQDLQIVADGNHPDLAQSINGPATRSECASIKLACKVHDIPAVGYYLAATKLSAQANSAMWWVTYLAGELSPADREAGALSVLLHMMQTFRLNPQWQQQSLQTTAAVSQNYRTAAQQMSNAIVSNYWSQQAFNDQLNQSYWNRQAVQDHAASNFSDMMRGNQVVQDGQTGSVYKVQSQANHLWIDPGGNITGTDLNSPGLDWRELKSLP